MSEGSTAAAPDAEGHPRVSVHHALIGVGLMLVVLGGFTAHEIQTVGGSVRVENVRFPSADGKRLSALLYTPDGGGRRAQSARHSRRARIHQLARNAERFRDRIRAPRLRRAGARSKRPRALAAAGFCQRLRWPRCAEVSARARDGGSGQHRSRRPLHGRLGRTRGRRGATRRLQSDGAGRLGARKFRCTARHTGVSAQPGGGIQRVRTSSRT
jgi:hypothetical protein